MQAQSTPNSAIQGHFPSAHNNRPRNAPRNAINRSRPIWTKTTWPPGISPYILVIMLVCGVWVAFLPGQYGLFAPMMMHVHEIGLFIFRSQSGLRKIVIFTIAAHFIEGLYAMFLIYELAGDRWHPVAIGWFLQTFVIGFPSLNMLIKEKENACALEN